MHTIAVISQKGGAGKTTLTISLAEAAEHRGMKPLIIDLDPQANACKWRDIRDRLGNKPESPIVISSQPARLGAVLAQAAENGIDITFIDTPPALEHSALEAARVADLILIPVRAQTFDLQTVPNTWELLKLVRDKPIIAILNAIPALGERHEQAQKVLQTWNIPVCPYMLGNRVAFGDATSLGKTVIEYEPKGQAAQEVLNVYNHAFSIIDNLKTQQLTGTAS